MNVDLPFKSYFICTSPRSGSTLLCKLLAETGCAGVPDSHFHNPSLEDWRRGADMPVAALDDRRAELTEIIAHVKKLGSGDTGIFGCRLQRGSFAFFDEQLAYLHPELNGLPERMNHIFGKSLFIALRREDKLSQAISLVKAQQTGLWHRNADGTELERTAPPTDPQYDFAAIKGKVDELSQLDADWDAWFKQTGIKPLRITYDELSANPQVELARILSALDCDPSVAETISPPVKKLSDQTNLDWIERFKRDQAR